MCYFFILVEGYHHKDLRIILEDKIISHETCTPADSRCKNNVIKTSLTEMNIYFNEARGCNVTLAMHWSRLKINIDPCGVTTWTHALSALQRHHKHMKTASQRAHSATIMPLWRQNDVVTSFWRHNDVIFAPSVRWYFMGYNLVLENDS